MKASKNGDYKQLAIYLPNTLIRRIRHEAARSDQTVKSIVENTLDAHLPEIQVVVYERKNGSA